MSDPAGRVRFLTHAGSLTQGEELCAVARLTAAARYKDGPWQANLALSGLAQQFVFEAGVYQNIDVRTPMLTPRVDINHTSEKAAGLTNVVTRFGGEVQIGRASVDLALPIEQREGEPMPAYDPKDVTETFHGHIWVGRCNCEGR